MSFATKRQLFRLIGRNETAFLFLKHAHKPEFGLLCEPISIFLSRSPFFPLLFFSISSFLANFIAFFCVELWLASFIGKGQI